MLLEAQSIFLPVGIVLVTSIISMLIFFLKNKNTPPTKLFIEFAAAKFSFIVPLFFAWDLFNATDINTVMKSYSTLIYTGAIYSAIIGFSSLLGKSLQIFQKTSH